MRHNHFSMLPERAFKPRAFGGMTLEGGGGGGGGGGGEQSTPSSSRNPNPQPVAPYTSAGGGFMGRTPFGTGGGSPIEQKYFDSDRYLRQNLDVARDPYYGQNPYHHYQDFGFTERRSPFEGFQYNPSQQPMYNPAYMGQTNTGLLNLAYQKILGRGPSSYDMDVMGNQMRQGLTGQGLVSFGTSSPEFQRRQEFNRAYTEAFRPDYKEFGPSGQYYQPIYQSSYAAPSRFYSPGYGSFGGQFNNPFMYATGGEIEQDTADENETDDQGITRLLSR